MSSENEWQQLSLVPLENKIGKTYQQQQLRNDNKKKKEENREAFI